MRSTKQVSSTNAKVSGSTPAEEGRAVAMTVESIKSYAPRAARYEIKDAVVPGLRLVVQPSSAKSWALRYSHRGQYRKLTIGPWPLIPLAESAEDRKARLAKDPASDPPDARGIARAALARKATGTDPIQFMKAQARETAETAIKAERDKTYFVPVLWEEFLKRPHKRTGNPKRASSRKRYEGIFAPVLAKWESRDARSITEDDCNVVLKEAGERGDHAKASLFMLLNGFFGWVEKKTRGKVPSPLRYLEREVTKSTSGRTLDNSEVKLIWNASDSLGVFGRLVQMLLLTGQRRTECASMQYSEIDFEKKIWKIPGGKTKNGDSHIVFLSEAALKIIGSIPRVEGSDFVFKGDGPTHFKGFSKGKIALDKVALTSQPWKLHDLRRTFMTRIVEDLRITETVAHKILNHGGGSDAKSELKRIYLRSEFEDERRAAMTAWALKLESIVTGAPASNVVPLRATAEAVPA